MPVIAEKKSTFAMIVDVEKCIGCGKCVIACKIENSVPMNLSISRTWIEGYFDGKKIVMNTRKNPFLEVRAEKGLFVPKLCNHCSNAPCVNVCPCIGCKYCITACPTNARVFGELREGSEIYEILKRKRYSVLKPETGTNPKVFYVNLDTVVE